MNKAEHNVISKLYMFTCKLRRDFGLGLGFHVGPFLVVLFFGGGGGCFFFFSPHSLRPTSHSTVRAMVPSMLKRIIHVQPMCLILHLQIGLILR